MGIIPWNYTAAHTHLFFNIGLSCVYCIVSLHSHLECHTSFKLLLKTKLDQSKINDSMSEVVQETTDAIEQSKRMTLKLKKWP